MHEFDDKMQAAEYLNQNLKAGDVVYLKASNAIGLKEIYKISDGAVRRLWCTQT